MTDRELLKLAAKASGYSEVFFFPGDVARFRSGETVGMVDGMEWNPLTDDGDALRLAVKLSLFVNSLAKGKLHPTGISCAGDHNRSPMESFFCKEEHKEDAAAATRRAIVRAAAAIGEAMP